MSLPEDKVIQLIKMMNTTSTIEIPAQPPIIECFNIAMNETVLDYLLAVGPEVRTTEELRTIYNETIPGASDEGWASVWSDIMEMSFLVPDPEEDGKYVMSSIFPGWIELSVSGPLTPKRKAILSSFMGFWAMLKDMNIAPVRMMSNRKGARRVRDGIAPHLSTRLASSSREVQLNTPLESEQKAFTTQTVYELIEKYEDIAVMNCFCRTYKGMTSDEQCKHGLPLEACMSFGTISKHLVENGVGRKITREEATELIDKFAAAGCIHTAFHHGNSYHNEMLAICNCCRDCCLLYKGYQESYLSQIFTRAFYVPKLVDADACSGCNKCGEYCPSDAMYYDNEKGELVFNYENCIGCGQCVLQCRFDVHEMIPDERSVFVPTKAPENEDKEAARKWRRNRKAEREKAEGAKEATEATAE